MSPYSFTNIPSHSRAASSVKQDIVRSATPGTRTSTIAAGRDLGYAIAAGLWNEYGDILAGGALSGQVGGTLTNLGVETYEKTRTTLTFLVCTDIKGAGFLWFGSCDSGWVAVPRVTETVTASGMVGGRIAGNITHIVAQSIDNLAVAPGTATITVTTVDGSKTATCAVTVSSRIIPVTGVVLDKTTATLGMGGTTTLVATVAPADATNANVAWTSSNPSAATVAGGVVTAVALGTTTITATTEDGSFTATCDVTVAPTFFGFTSTGVVFQKLGVDGDWSQVNAGTSGAALGLVISNNGNDFYGITTAATNGAIWQMTGPAGTWASASTNTASGTMKAAFYDGTNFYGFTGSGKFNTKTGVAGTWAASNLGGTTGFAIAAVTFDGTTFLGFQADGSVWSNTPAQVVTANTWTTLSTNTAGVVLVSVVPNGAGDFFAISADGQLYKKTGTAGTWGNVSTKVAGSALIAIVYK